MIKYSVLLILLLGVHCILSYSCCVPSQWQGSSLSHDDSGTEFTKNYYYDAANLLVRIDIIYSDGSFNQSTYSSYASLTQTGSEWVLNNLDGSCYATGPDYWNSQCFGDKYGVPFVSSTNKINTFSNPSNGITVITDIYCLPISITNKLSNLEFNFFNTQSYISDETVFSAPPSCK
ncbi:hypothetical protein RB653_001823 [Dictyostelium firmibasis]|uniref:Uncharacterized protein n=1 Tax=Dictyostelium firmibasis TaxID=79012 RepID=A0AAN7YPJ4_9MYCE